MQSNEIRQRFLKFFEKRGHKIIPSASLVPENDPSVLFNTAGMQPLVPYLLGQPHPMGNRLVNVQKCVRTQDIEEVGDNTHDTFFEMMGNWSLGDYFKEDAIKWSYEFLTSKEEGLGLDPQRLYVTVFEGNEDAPRDEEAASIWRKIFEKEGITGERIYFRSAKSNWWEVGENGPCGPDTEMFYDLTGNLNEGMTFDEYKKADDSQQVVEIWNDVFMEYEKKDGKVVGKLKNKNVDTGSGLERVVMAVQGKDNIFETDLFNKSMNILKHLSGSNYIEKNARIIADHIRTSVMMINDGVLPSNKDQGYILRRLIRRALVQIRPLVGSFAHAGSFKFVSANILESEPAGSRSVFEEVIGSIFEVYEDTDYIKQDKYYIRKVILDEELKFRRGLENGFSEIEKGNMDPFILWTTHGFPIELTIEIARSKNIEIDLEDFHKKMSEHQKLSQTSSAGMFKGGLANHNEKTIKLHTAHHLLLAGLQALVSPEIKQRGSNITEERLRIDFSFERKLTDEEKAKVEAWVNEKISEDLVVVRREMPLAEAEKIGAQMEFGAKYPEMVSVYFIEDKSGNPVSKEFCGGPHVEHTGVLGTFKINKEEAVSAGVRRIKATLS